MANLYVQLRDAQGNNIFPRINTANIVNDAKLVNETQLAEAIAASQHLSKEIVTALPAVSEAKENTIYLILKQEGDAGYVVGENIYDEFMLINGAFEKIGNTKVDLTNYYTKSEVDGAIDADVAALKQTVDAYTVNGKQISSAPVLTGEDIALTGYTAVEGGVGLAATDSINAAFKKIDENFKTLSGDSTESIGAVVGRVSTLESVTKGFTAEGEIKSAVDAKADKTYVDGIVGSEGTLTAAVAANTAAVATKAEKDYVDGIKGDLETAINGKVAQGDFDALEDRVETAEGEIDALQEGIAKVYTKDEVNALLGEEGVAGDIAAVKSELEGKINGKVAQGDFDTLEGRVDTAEADIETIEKALSGLLTEGAVQAALNLKANAADVYTKDDIDGKVQTINGEIDKKANSADVYAKTETYTKSEVNALLISYVEVDPTTGEPVVQG